MSLADTRSSSRALATRIPLRPLSAPTEDARSLEELLRNRDVGAFHLRPIVDQPSWVVEMEVERFFRARRLERPCSLLPGRGIKDEDGALYFATMNTDPETLRSTTLSSEDVTAAMRRCRSRQQVIVFDCCYAGAFSKAMFAKGSERIGMQERFATGGAGRVVLASDAMQIALEGGQVHGEQTLSVFTRAFVEGIQSGAADRNGDGLVSLDELYDCVYEQVRNDNPEQTPTISNLERRETSSSLLSAMPGFGSSTFAFSSWPDGVCRQETCERQRDLATSAEKLMSRKQRELGRKRKSQEWPRFSGAFPVAEAGNPRPPGNAICRQPQPVRTQCSA